MKPAPKPAPKRKPPTARSADPVSTPTPHTPDAVPSPAPTATVKAAVRVRPLVDSERHPQQAVSVGAAGASPCIAARANEEVIRVVTAAGRMRRSLTSPFVLEVLEQPLPSASGNKGTSREGQQRSARGPPSQSTLPAQQRAKEYAFDYCAGPSTTQAELFALLEVPALCEAALSGEVVTLFCFGQTGSGKTFTLSGRTLSSAGQESSGAAAAAATATAAMVAEDGLQYQAVAYVARRLEMRHTAVSKRHKSATPPALGGGVEATRAATAPTVTAKCSYVELYQEALYDLLQPTSAEAVRCRWSAAAQAFYVEGSLLVECRTEEDFLMVLREGERNRQRGSHALNRDSSRSHAVFTVFFETVTHDEEATPGSRRHGRLVFVDLAGSERLKKSQSSSTAETGAINKSLFTLGRVLELLSTAGGSSSSSPPPFIPYRSSILTQLLMQSLDGHGRTLMVACVSPSVLHLDESLRTIHYAERAQHIHSTPVVHVDAVTQQRLALEAQVRELRRENALLRRVLGLPRTSEPLQEEEVEARVEHLLSTKAATMIRATAGPPLATATSTQKPPAKQQRPRATAGVHSAPSPPSSVTSPSPPPQTAALPSSPSTLAASEEDDAAAPVPADGGGKKAVSILALLDALPDTRPLHA